MRVSKFTGGVRRLGHAVLELPGTWRRSLPLRVVSLTLLLSVFIAFALGWVLNSQIRNGLVKAKESSSLAMVRSGFGEFDNGLKAQTDGVKLAAAQAAQAGASGGNSSSDMSAAWKEPLTALIGSLCSGAGNDTYQVMLVDDSTSSPFGTLHCGNIIAEKTIPKDLSAPGKLEVYQETSNEHTV